MSVHKEFCEIPECMNLYAECIYKDLRDRLDKIDEIAMYTTALSWEEDIDEIKELAKPMDTEKARETDRYT